MFSASGLRAIIRTTLLELNLWSVSAEELLLGTAAQESHLGRWLHQIGGGPARGVFQMEISTEKDIWENFLKFRTDLKLAVQKVSGVNGPNINQLAYNPIYGIAMARCHYLRVKVPLPDSHDLQAAGEYWDNFYNRNPKVGFASEYVENFVTLILRQEART